MTGIISLQFYNQIPIFIRKKFNYFYFISYFFTYAKFESTVPVM